MAAGLAQATPREASQSADSFFPSPLSVGMGVGGEGYRLNQQGSEGGGQKGYGRPQHFDSEPVVERETGMWMETPPPRPRAVFSSFLSD